MRPPTDWGRQRFPLAVAVLVSINIAVFAAEVRCDTPGEREAFINAYALIPFDLTHGVQLDGAPPTLLTLVTSQFFHGSALHVSSNLLVLLVFGPRVECMLGHGRFVAFYLACGVLGGIAELSVTAGSHVPGIGASGAIAGVLGAYVVRFPTHDIATIAPGGCLPAALRVPAFLVIGLWALAQFAHGFGTLSERVLSEQGGGTAYFAHIGGFLAGVFLVSFARGPRTLHHDR